MPALIRSNEMARRCALALVLAAIYVALSWVSSLHQYKGLLIRPWNPGVGLMFAVIVLGGAWYGVVLFAGSVAASIIVRHGILGWPGMLGAATIIAAGYTSAAFLARRRLQMDTGLGRLRDIAILLATGILGTIAVALLITATLATLGRLGSAELVPAFFRLLVGNIIGISIVAPLALRLARRWREGSLGALARIGPELALYAVLIVLMLWAIISFRRLDDFLYFYALFLPVIAASVRHGLDGACISLAVTQLGLVVMLRNFGYDAIEFTEFQIVMFILTATGLVVGVVVTERQEIDRAARQAEVRLKQKEAEATRAARFSLVSGMASSLAHDVNQPMTAARALARSVQQILQNSPADLARADRNLTQLIAQIDHAGGIVRRTRDFLSRAHPHVSTLDVRTLLEDALALIRPEAAARDIDIHPDLPDDLPSIDGDRIQLQQVILNLVRNGIDSIGETRPSHGYIRVSARRDGEQIVIGVADNGAGVADEIGTRLFQPLITSKPEGLGLGLAICSSILDAHGGRIWLETSAPGATEFRFALPLRTPPQAVSS